jgi:hypothetical protein
MDQQQKIEAFNEILSGIYQRNGWALEKVSEWGKNQVKNDEVIIVTYSTGGSSGGNCYGGYTSRFDDSESEQIDSLVDNMSFCYDFDEALGKVYTKKDVDAVCTKFAEDIVNGYSYFADYEEGYDYYGNYRAYKVASIEISAFFEKVLSHEDFALFKTVFDERHLEQEKQDRIAKNLEALKKVNEQLDEFSQTQDKNRANLEKEVQRTEALLEKLKKNLSGFDQQSEKESKQLIKQRKSLEQNLEADGVDYQAQAQTHANKKKKK